MLGCLACSSALDGPSVSELRSCVKVEVAVLGSPSLISLVVSVEIKHHWIKPSVSELRSCVKVEVYVLGSPAPNSPYGLC